MLLITRHASRVTQPKGPEALPGGEGGSAGASPSHGVARNEVGALHHARPSAMVWLSSGSPAGQLEGDEP